MRKGQVKVKRVKRSGQIRCHNADLLFERLRALAALVIDAKHHPSFIGSFIFSLFLHSFYTFFFNDAHFDTPTA